MTISNYNRGVNASLVSQMPPDYDILVAGSEITTGDWVAIKVYNEDFPDDETSFEVDYKGKNMSALKGYVPNGDSFIGHFTKIVIPAGNTMRIVAYHF